MWLRTGRGWAYNVTCLGTHIWKGQVGGKADSRDTFWLAKVAQSIRARGQTPKAEMLAQRKGDTGIGVDDKVDYALCFL